MKNNRKNRKLKFIRVKNNLRFGKIKFYCTEKASNQLNEDENYFERLVSIAKKSLQKHYKLSLRNVLVQSDIIDDDFAKDIHTNIVTLYN